MTLHHRNIFLLSVTVSSVWNDDECSVPFVLSFTTLKSNRLTNINKFTTISFKWIHEKTFDGAHASRPSLYLWNVSIGWNKTNQKAFESLPVWEPILGLLVETIDEDIRMEIVRSEEFIEAWSSFFYEIKLLLLDSVQWVRRRKEKICLGSRWCREIMEQQKFAHKLRLVFIANSSRAKGNLREWRN